METIGLYILKSGILLAVFLSIYRFCLRKETFYLFNRFFLLAGGMIAMLLPLVTVHFPVVVTTPEYPLTLEWSTVAPLITDAVGQSSVLQNFLLYMNGLLVVYCVGAGLLLVIRIYGLLRLFAIIRRCGYRTFQNYKLVENRVFKSSFSFLDYIFFPAVEMDTISKEMILKHEQAHVSQHHWVDLFFINFLCVLGWFNPFVWFYARAIRENHEYLADNAVICSCRQLDYQKVLVNHWLKVPVFPMANSFCCSTQLKRITMMKKNKSCSVRMLSSLLCVPALFVFLWFFAEPRYVMAQEKNNDMTTSQSAKIESVTTMNKDSLKLSLCQVFDEEGRPMAGAKVIMFRDAKEKEKIVTTDKDGICTFKLDSQMHLVIKAPGYKTVQTVVAVNGKGSASFTISMEKETKE